MPTDHPKPCRPPSSHSDQNPSNEPDAADYSPAGVDRSLIRWMLHLSPTQRLQVIQDQINAIQEFRGTLDTH